MDYKKGILALGWENQMNHGVLRPYCWTTRTHFSRSRVQRLVEGEFIIERRKILGTLMGYDCMLFIGT
jgi:hypothetical protein